MRALLLSLACLCSVSAANNNWEHLSKTEQHELLWDLDYASPESLPSGTIKVDMVKSAASHPKYALYAEKIMNKLEGIGRESIDQSPYSTFGEEELVNFILLVKGDEILGAKTYLYQDGRDQEGNDSDVNWSANIMFDSEGEFFTDEDGSIIDELRFEWSGH